MCYHLDLKQMCSRDKFYKGSTRSSNNSYGFTNPDVQICADQSTFPRIKTLVTKDIHTPVNFDLNVHLSRILYRWKLGNGKVTFIGRRKITQFWKKKIEIMKKDSISARNFLGVQIFFSSLEIRTGHFRKTIHPSKAEGCSDL